jgi:hypothetical protein
VLKEGLDEKAGFNYVVDNDTVVSAILHFRQYL